jgi:hypothetical protein
LSIGSAAFLNLFMASFSSCTFSLLSCTGHKT